MALEMKERMKIDRQAMPEQDPRERGGNFMEVPHGLSEELAVLEAQRCLDCPKQPCVEGCPVNVKIPEFISLIAEGKFVEAAWKLKETNALPAVCGRVCPQESQCESMCIRGRKGEPVAIGNLERFAADHERNSGKIEIPKKEPDTKKKVAVVGSGPAGLTVAGDLIKKGHEVHIFEALHAPGGVLVYGIPEFRLPKEIVYAEVDYLRNLGCKLHLNRVVGPARSVKELKEEDGFDAVYLGLGAGLPWFMQIPGENLTGVYSANEYLTRSNLMKAYEFPKYDTPIVRGNKVVVVGGGNVAMDSVRTALRLGAERAMIVYRRSMEELPARAAEVHHAKEEGIDFNLLVNPIEILGDGEGRVRAVRCIRMELGEPDSSGRRRPVPVEGSEFELECDTVVIAIGTSPNPVLTSTMPELELNHRGNIVADDNGRTSVEGVWAGGDIVTGSATVIAAMGAGRVSADDIHRYLSEAPSDWK